MYFRIAFTNIKKSYKDYTIYFLTLILGVCMFYSFNSIGSQKALIDIKSSGVSYISKLTEIMSAVSILVSIILGCLILYANNFWVKKRKKELGIYMILGMGKRKISLILVIETFVVGVVSLIAGIILGIVMSQVLSVFSLKLFQISIGEYMFSISINAIVKTIAYFGIMFSLVMIFNIFVISKYKIINLLTVGRKNENIKFKNPVIYLLAFVLSVVLLGFSYATILKVGFDSRDPIFRLSIILLVVGTVVFFFSLSGVILYIANKNKKVYFKGLNIFIVKQINSKINTNFISMSLICLMLFITILTLSTGINIKKESEARIDKETPFDASIIVSNNSKKENLEDVLNKIKFKTSKNEKYITYNEYRLGIKASNLLMTKDKEYNDIEVSFVKISDYNKMLKLKGEKEISLDNDQVLLISNYNALINLANKRLKSNNKINIKGKEYSVKSDKIIEGNLETSFMPYKSITVVINDDFLSNYNEIHRSVLSVMYSDNNREENNKKYNQIDYNFLHGKYESLNLPNVYAYSKERIHALNMRRTTSILFVGIYLGLVFLITSMAVLSIQQLSEASDSIERYRSLKRIGATRNMIDKTIFIQTFIYFSLPVILALIHSIIGILVVNKDLSNFNSMDIRFSALMTTLIFIVVYVGYFYTTYLAYKNIVKNNI
ncbi:ABC transporter permease [Clostridium sardiniense]